MSFTKKQKYFSKYLGPINRKVLYTEPIFLLDVSVNKETVGAAPSYDEEYQRFEILLPCKLNKSRELLFNIAQFADNTMESRSAVSVVLRELALKSDSRGKLVSIKDTLMNTYNLLIETHADGKCEVLEFPQNPFDVPNAKHVAIIDFNVNTQDQANIVGALKQLYFDYTGEVVCASERTMIDYMKKKNYKIQASGKIVCAEGVVPSYCLLFTKS